jgi:RNA polymerase sigma-70 factor (ECF subfamily)
VAGQVIVRFPASACEQAPIADDPAIAEVAAETMQESAGWGDLMTAAQSGHGGAYRRLLEQTACWLRGYFARRLPYSMVDDAVQETLLGLHEKRHTYDPLRPFGQWLVAIARYKWIDRLRAQRTASAEVLPDHLSAEDHAPAVTSAVVLERLLETLNPRQALAIRLVKIQGLSIQEAAVRSGQSVSLIKVNIHRGLARLTALVRSETDATQ